MSSNLSNIIANAYPTHMLNAFKPSFEINRLGFSSPAFNYVEPQELNSSHKELMKELANFYDVMDMNSDNAGMFVISSASFNEEVYHIHPPLFLQAAIQREYGKKPLRIAFTRTSYNLKVTILYIDKTQEEIETSKIGPQGGAPRFIEWILNLAAYERYCYDS